MSKKFKLYALRDNLTIGVMNSTVDSGCEEYQFLIGGINNAIKIYDMDFSISLTMKSIIAYQLQSKETAKIKRIANRLQASDANPILKEVFNGYFNAVGNIVNKEMQLAFLIFTILGYCIKLFENNKQEIVEYRSSILDNVLPAAA